MKKKFIFPMILATVPAFATTFYYETSGQCSRTPGLFMTPNATSCSQAITQIIPPSKSGRTFTGYYLGGTKVIDENGNILVTSADAPELLQSTVGDTERTARAAYNEPGKINVVKDTKWEDGWYKCSGVQNQYCMPDQDLYMPYAPHCWTYGTQSQIAGYDYVFNSWLLADNGTFMPASNPNNWIDCYLYPAGAGTSQPNYSPGCTSNISIGDSFLPGGCTNTYLAYGSTPISDRKIKPFACKKLTDANGEYKMSIPVLGGTIELDNSTAGECTYKLTCNSGYSPINGTDDITCHGTDCKNYTNVTNVDENFLITKGLGCNPIAYNYVTVTLDTTGGNIDGETTIQVAPGSKLTSYVPDRSMYDGAIFAGWVKDGSNSAPDKNATVNADAGTSVTYHAAYTCPDGRDMNQYNVCVSDEDEYLTPGGVAMSPYSVQCWRLNSNGEYENYCYWRVAITFHNNNQGFNLNAGADNEGRTLTCTGARGCSASWCTQGAGTLCAKIPNPKATNYVFRGYFRDRKNNEDLIVDQSTTESGAFSIFYPKRQDADDIDLITGQHAVVVVGNTPVTLSNDWSSMSPYTLAVYGGWARKCDAGTNASCELTIGTNWTPVNGFGKGDVKYNTSCDDGFVLQSGNNAYNPECVKEAGTIDLTYTFIDQYGFTLDNCSVPADTCDSDINAPYYYMPNSTICGSGYTLKYLGTYSGLYTPAHQVRCSSTVFGSSTPRSVVGYVCRNTCTPESSVSHGGTGTGVLNGICVNAQRAGGTLNGNEYVENIFDGCYAIQCNNNYKLKEVDGSVECVLNTETN